MSGAVAQTNYFDAIIVGAGIIGAAVALELSRQGRKVVVVDAASAPGMGSTAASSAIIRVHYTRRDCVTAARELLLRLAGMVRIPGP